MSRAPHSTPPKPEAAERWQKSRPPHSRPPRIPHRRCLSRRSRAPASHPSAIAWSLALVLPGLALRPPPPARSRRTVNSPSPAPTRTPETRSISVPRSLPAASLALLSWSVALLLAFGFAAIYIPVIASEERFLRATFPGFDAYCRAVPRFIPRPTPARFHAE